MESFVKTLRILKILGILIVIVGVFYLTDYIVYRKTGESLVFFKSAGVQEEEGKEPTPENTLDDNAENNEERENFNEELKETENDTYKEAMTAFLNQKENNGFILGNYQEPSKMDPYYIFATGEYYVKDDAKIKQYENMTESTVTTGLYKVSADEAIKVFLDKTGEEFSEDDIREMMARSFVYLPPDDSYYTLNSDDLFSKVQCTKVEQIEDKLVVSYEPEGNVGNHIKGVVTLKRNSNQDGLIFLSNEITHTNLY